MSSATKIKLGILTLLLALLGGKLLGDTVKSWLNGNEKGVINLPAAAMQNQNTVASATSYRYGYRMSQIENGSRLIPPSAMMECIVVSTSAGILISVNAIEGDIVISGETLVMLRDNDVLSFSFRIIDIEENYIDVKYVLEPGSQAYQVLVR